MNKTFEGNDTHYNACVGINGHIDFLTYSDGYDEFVKNGLEELETLKSPVDIIVYPLIYCARHRIELFLKHQLIKIDYLKSNILESRKSSEIKGTHEISKLWKWFINETLFETRFKESIEHLNEFVMDFVQIDDTGEIFRYPETKGKEKHLKDIHVVNLLSFKKRYLEFSEKLNELEHLSNYLVSEYEQRTFAGSLSREKIKEIAYKLPNINTWRSEGEQFSEIKIQLKEEYNISSSVLCKAIDLIKGNFEFSLIIGQELILKEINSTELNSFKDLYEDFLKNKDKGIDYNNIEKYIVSYKEKLSSDAIYNLAQLYDIGYYRLFPDEYFKGLALKKKQNIDTLILNYFLRNGIALESIISGLTICKQNTLLAQLK